MQSVLVAVIICVSYIWLYELTQNTTAMTKFDHLSMDTFPLPPPYSSSPVEVRKATKSNKSVFGQQQQQQRWRLLLLPDATMSFWGPMSLFFS